MARSANLERIRPLARPDRAPSDELPASHAFASLATVERVDSGFLQVRNPLDAAGGSARSARLAIIPGYSPAVDDEVLVAETTAGPVVIAVLRASHAPAIAAPDGARAELATGGLEIRDPEGRLVVRYVDGAAEVAPIAGDLVLRAPSGSVRIDAAADVWIGAQRDAIIAGARRSELRLSHHGDVGGASNVADEVAPRVSVERKGVTLAGPNVEARAKRMRLVAGGADVIAQAIRTSATTIETRARKIDVTAEHIVERAKDAIQEVSGLLETRAGRIRSLVRGAFSLRAKTTAMRSSEDTSIDGKRVLLG